jgi:hypothetical protein
VRALALAAAVVMFAAPSFAKTKSKGPKEGQYCKKTAAGTTATDAKGASLTCRADKKGKYRWDK